jgi:MFS superfamily sulfate permease-like transporter
MKIAQKNSWIFYDISASIVVFLVALPLCLGIALGSGAPLSSGIIAGLIGGVVIGLLSKSSLSVSGPAAGLIAIVILALQQLGSFEVFLLAVVLAGFLQIIFGFLKLGTLGDFVPNAVIKGMLAAIGVILIIKQVPHFFGYDLMPAIDENSMRLTDQKNSFFELTKISDNVSFVATLIGGVSIVILMLFEFDFIKKRKFLKIVPAPLIVVVVGVLINQYFLVNDAKIALKQEHLVWLGAGSFELKTFLIFPNFSQILNPKIWYFAFTIAIVASIETLLCIEAIDKVDKLRRRTPTNRELKAQGVGNMIAGLIGGLPITSVIVRSSANENAGAKSKLSAILHGFWLILAVILIPNILNKIPYSALAAILIFTGFKLTNPKIFKDLYKLGFDQLIPFLITIIAILMTNLLLGIAIGLLVSIAFIMHSNSSSAITLVNNKKNYLLRFRKDVSFLNKANVKRALEKIPRASLLIIDVTKTDFIDKDIIEVINDFQKHARLNRVKVEIKKNNFNELHKLII